VNTRFVSLILSGILLIEGLLMLVCLLFALFSERGSGMLFSWAVSVMATLAFSGLCYLLGRRAERKSIFKREAFAVVGLSWLICGVFAAIPFALAPAPIPLWDALFESYSGLTTTGATIFKDLTLLPGSLLLWRAITQWMGGMGVVVLFVALLGFIGVGGKALFIRETSALAEGDLKPRAQSLTIRYLAIYLGITLVGAVGLLVFGMSLFDAVTHTMCAISTGGFSPHNESIAHFSAWYVQAWIIVIMFMGGIAFPVHYHLWVLRKFGVLHEHRETRLYGAIIIIATIIVALDLMSVEAYTSAPRAALDSLFQVVSIMTTTGFCTADFNQWPALSVVVLLLLMMIGGCAGSTGGGLKVARLMVFVKAALREVRVVFRPQLVLRVTLNRRTIGEHVVRGVVFYFAIYFVLMILGILGLSMLEPHLDLTSVMSALIASFNNIGPGLGEVGPASNYAALHPPGKIWLCLFMLLGRIEIYAILLLFLPSFWRKF
jgi:trk system potassium uptake protein TrkH